jgi:hypothetical protein
VEENRMPKMIRTEGAEKGKTQEEMERRGRKGS